MAAAETTPSCCAASAAGRASIRTSAHLPGPTTAWAIFSAASESSGLYPGRVPEDTGLTRADLTAAVAARRELGPDYEDAVLDSFLTRLDRQTQARVDAMVAERLSSGTRQGAGAPSQKDPGLTLGVVSLIAGVPVTAIATTASGVTALIVAWGGIAAVNVAQAWGRRRAG